YKKIPYHIDYDLFAQNLNQIIEVCKEYGIKLAYENVHYSYFDTPGFFEKLKPRCPELYATFDCKHCRQGGGSSEKFLQAIGDRLATVHLCDVNLDNTTTLPYQGVVDFEALFLYLKDHHPKAVLLLELYGHNYQDVSQIKSVYDQTKQHMETVQTKFIKFC
ncbi:MAG: sugar phosphate isomerase/epimerase, partial [Firmicutes bacterium]|nr:sugar phosphate isomerase/epimerase [Bacillota bacterium]